MFMFMFMSCHVHVPQKPRARRTASVGSVTEGSAAQIAGLLVGDVITECDGVKLRRTLGSILGACRKRKNARSVKLTVERPMLQLGIVPLVAEGEHV